MDGVMFTKHFLQSHFLAIGEACRLEQRVRESVDHADKVCSMFVAPEVRERRSWKGIEMEDAAVRRH